MKPVLKSAQEEVLSRYQSCTREELIAELDKALAKVPPEYLESARFELDTEDDYDIERPVLYINYTRPENEKEIEERERAAAQQLKWQRKQYEALKKQFEEKK